MQRILIGILGLAGIAATAVMFFTGQMSDNLGLLIGSIFFRCGIVLCLAWLAYPQLERVSRLMPKWAWGLILPSVLLVVIRPKLFPVALILIAIVGGMQGITWFFKPPAGSSSRRTNTGRKGAGTKPTESKPPTTPSNGREAD